MWQQMTKKKMKTFSSRVYTVTVAAHSVSLSQAIERQIYTQLLCFIFQWNFYLYSRCVFCLPAYFHQSIDPFISFRFSSKRWYDKNHNRENRVNIYVAFKNIYALSTFDSVSRCSFDTSNMIFFFLLLFRLKSSWIGNMIGDHALNMWYIYRLYFGTVTSSFFLVFFGNSNLNIHDEFGTIIMGLYWDIASLRMNSYQHFLHTLLFCAFYEYLKLSSELKFPHTI